jgi:folate-dependent phosphoribosylglycinamide formyltransferase PurN
MRVVFLAADDEFAGEMQRPLYERHPDWIVGSVVSSCVIYKKSKLGAFLFTLRQSGLVFLIEMVHIKTLRWRLGKQKRFLPSRLARSHGVEQFVSADINDQRSVAKLRSWNPDLIISTNFSHYIGKTVRECVARYGCWNLHKSLLPKYRGMAPSFHALLNGSTKVGATLHVVAKGFDSGDLLAQVEVPVTDTDSVYSLNRKTSVSGGKLLCSFLENYDPRSTHAMPQPVGEWKNYTYPTSREVRAFLRKGLRFYAPVHE